MTRIAKILLAHEKLLAQTENTWDSSTDRYFLFVTTYQQKTYFALLQVFSSYKEYLFETERYNLVLAI